MSASTPTTCTARARELLTSSARSTSSGSTSPIPNATGDGRGKGKETGRPRSCWRWCASCSRASSSTIGWTSTVGRQDARAVPAARAGWQSTASAWCGKPARRSRLLGLPPRQPGLETRGHARQHAHRHRRQGRQPAAQRRPDGARRVRRPRAGAAARHGRVDEAARPLDLRLHAGPASFDAAEDCRLTYNPARTAVRAPLRLAVRHLHLDGLAGKVEYAQLLNDASESSWQQPHRPARHRRRRASHGR